LFTFLFTIYLFLSRKEDLFLYCLLVHAFMLYSLVKFSDAESLLFLYIHRDDTRLFPYKFYQMPKYNDVDVVQILISHVLSLVKTSGSCENHLSIGFKFNVCPVSSV